MVGIETATPPRAARVRLVELAVFRVPTPTPDGVHTMSGGRSYAEPESLVVRVTSEDGTSGHGEVSTLDGDYLDGFTDSALATIARLAPIVLAGDPLQAAATVAAMDRAVIGHLPGKSAIDIALWDLRGRLLDLPAATLLGGIVSTSLPAFCAVTIASPRGMAAEAERWGKLGYRRWQIKVGEDPVEDADRVRAVVDVIGERHPYLACDANRGWSSAEAIRFSRALAGVETILEQPCSSLVEVARVAAATGRPIAVDEIVKEPRDLLAAVESRCADALNLKPTRVGGLTKAARIRDLAAALGVMVTVDEPLGGALAGAAIAQLGATVDPRLLLGVSFFGTAPGGPTFDAGEVTVPTGPGLGVVPDEDFLDEPVLVVQPNR
ncbi:MAG: mandelate racemase/muconate lactonizing enzyme family protein [Actinobacteria bacterium]|nr:mandelate racemase/muconate lactonizing enzyme family protein [Actinomycetota bacterium]